MLTLTAQIANVLHVEKGVKKDGTEYGGYHQVQMMVKEALQNGEERLSLQTMVTDHPERFKKLLGQMVTLPVRVWAAGKNDVRFQINSDADPVPVKT